MNKKYKIITHNDGYHADDIFACATLSIYLKKENKDFEIIRTREEEIIKAGDFVVDVGKIYDANNNRFDHHQKGGAGIHEGGVPYASFGLVWEKYGEEVSSSKDIARRIENKIVIPIDAIDNGVDISKSLLENTKEYTINSILSIFAPTWQEPWQDIDKAFFEALALAEKIIEREIKIAKSDVVAENEVKIAYENSTDKRLIVLDKHYPIMDFVINFPEVLYVIRPRGENAESFGVKAVRKDKNSFQNRKDFPKEWGGKDGEELAKITGVSDAIFCHKALFLVSAKSKAGAMALAQLAINA